MDLRELLRGSAIANRLLFWVLVLALTPLVIVLVAEAVFQPVGGQRSGLFFLSLVTLPAVGAGALFLASSISEQIRRLTATVRVISAGDLRQEVQTSGSDEL